MTIEWRGEGCFEIRNTGDRFSLITELPSRESGLTAPRSKTDVLVSVWSDLGDTLFSEEKEDRFVVSNPGEYERQGVFISGLKIGGEGESIKSAYLINIEDVKIGYLGEISEKEVNSNLFEFFEETDILIIPVGGNGMLDGEAAAKLVNQIEPKIVIPCYYKISGLKRKADALDVFLKEIGKKSENQNKLLIKKKDLNFEETKIIALEPV